MSDEKTTAALGGDQCCGREAGVAMGDDRLKNGVEHRSFQPIFAFRGGSIVSPVARAPQS
jgi:hypothetical protein